ncbi:MAG: hypothetical protein KC422_05660 [Trueperaceae bacterium]|nr:hypothetical protein [Trueperaceae bacterium]
MKKVNFILTIIIIMLGLTACPQPAAPGFTIELDTSNPSVEQGSSIQLGVTIKPKGDFKAPVSFSLEGVPSEITGTFSESSFSSSGSLTLAASPIAEIGTKSLKIIGTSGSLKAEANFDLTVSAPGSATVEGFTVISAVPATNTSVELKFNKPIAEGATDTVNYAITPELSILSASLSEDKQLVTLNTSSQTEVDYLITVTNLKDSDGKDLNADSKASFTGLKTSDPSDTTRPVVESVVALDSATLLVTFSEPVGEGAESVINYSITAPPPPEPQNLQTQSIILSIKAAQLSKERDQVTLTTFAQSNLEYSLSVVNVRDLARNLVQSNKLSFSGKPTSGAPQDTDGDKLNDIQEQTGWYVSLLNKGKKVGSEHVTSDPSLTDTDEDGILDNEEFNLKTNPRNADTDGDGLADGQEIKVFLTSPVDSDTDEDGLTDGDEVNGKVYKVNGKDQLVKTNPLQKDSDGDDFSDFYEVTTANRDPRLADLPRFQFDISELNITPNVVITKTNGTSSSVVKTTNKTITLEEGSTEEFSTSDAFTDNWFAKAGAKVGVEAGTDGFSVSGEASIEGGLGGDNTFSTSKTSATSATKAYTDSFETSESLEENESLSRETKEGILAVNVRVNNLSNVAFTMDGLQITVLKQKYGEVDPLNYENITSLNFQVESQFQPLKLQLGPAGTSEASSGILTFADTEVPGNLIEDLLLDPRGIVFSVANYNVSTNTDGISRQFNDQLQNVNDRTAHFKIDFGTARRGAIEDYHIATFNPVDNSGGVPLSFILEEILGLKHFDEATAPSLSDAEKETSYSTKLIDGVETIWRIRNVERNDAFNQRWLLIVQEGSGAQTTSSFDPSLAARNVILNPEKTATLALHIDEDGDGVPARLELKLGSSDKDTDSDGDELSDYFETYTDWIIRVKEKGSRIETTRVVRSSPANDDTDEDGLNDFFEFLSREEFISKFNEVNPDEPLPLDLGTPYSWLTDPTRPDTDLDFVSDSDELESSIDESGGTVKAIIPSLNPNDGDTDGDTLLDGEELILGSDPFKNDLAFFKDTDGDGLTDAEETNGKNITVFGQNTLGSPGVISGASSKTIFVTSDPSKKDTDGDGITDDQEFQLGLNPRSDDSDGDGLKDKAERDAGLKPNNADSDGDFLNDNFELNVGWTVSVTGKTTLKVKSDPNASNSDTDSFSDLTEFQKGTNPIKFDTDDDGTSDSSEASLGRNPLTKDRRVTLSYTSLKVSDDCDSDLSNSLERSGAGDYGFNLKLGKNNSLIVVATASSISRNVCNTIDETGCKTFTATSDIPGYIQIGSNQTLNLGTADGASRTFIISEADTLQISGSIQEIDQEFITGKIVADFTQTWDFSKGFSSFNSFTNGESITLTQTMSEDTQCQVKVNVEKRVQ